MTTEKVFLHGGVVGASKVRSGVLIILQSSLLGAMCASLEPEGLAEMGRDV